MSLSVFVKSASDLPNIEWWGKSDPLCTIDLEGEEQRTKEIYDNLNPEWNEKLSWRLHTSLSGSEVLDVKVFDYEKYRSNRLLGSVQIPLQTVVLSGSDAVNVALTDKKGAAMNSKINLELTYEAPERKEVSAHFYDEETLVGEAEVEETQEVAVRERAGKEGGAERGSGEASREVGRRRQVSVVGLSTEERRRKIAREKLPNKPMDWQVRVHVLEARRLVGGHVNPLVKVVCGSASKETSTRKSTNNPIFDEMLFFNFSERPQEMFDRLVEIKVLHDRAVIRNFLIGSFKLDLGLVFDEPGKCFIHKWLLLTDPDDPSNDTKGYLKISIYVIGPGDEPRPSPSSRNQELVDIESNLLRPAGVRLQPATLSVKIYQGEDMPIMDPVYFEKVKKWLHIGTEHKDRVDPFCIVSFAGKEGKTPVIWNQQDPVWNHQVNLAIRFPSMCERIRIQVLDRDKFGKDDFIGTTFINMSQISASQQKGFPPTFGPCFLNLYGSPREYSDFPDQYDYLNTGLIEGVAYRGRIMVEVEMSLGHFPTVKGEAIQEPDKKMMRPFLQHCRYKVYGVFFSATTVHPVDAPVEFEVSIGNYGNKLDTTTTAQASTTIPSNPMYDGRQYYYMPWFEDKPCVVVDSQWEDCTYRITSMNLLLNVADRLEARLMEVEKEMSVENYDVDAVKSLLNEILEKFISDLGRPLPPLGKQVTQLDKWRKQRRDKDWDLLEKAVSDLRKDPEELRDMVEKCKGFIAVLRDMATEPQQSIPDVIIWMLAGTKRVACTRIPAHKLFYTDGMGRGQLCNKVLTLFLKPPTVKNEKELKGLKDGAQLRLMLCLEKEEEKNKGKNRWAEEVKLIGGDFAVYAETYENETYLGKWGRDSVSRTRWSDAQGKSNPPPEEFEPPPGWSWFGGWFIHQHSLMYRMDDNRSEWQEEIYENQQRLPLSSWREDKSYWTDVHNDPVRVHDGKGKKDLTRDDIKCPEGWKWKEGPTGVEQWRVDMGQAVDEQGWEYAIEAGLGNWVPYERTGYLFRRRRWVRTRVKDKDEVFKRAQRKAQEEGWEYAHMAHTTYHLTEHKLDFARRRRHLRKMIGDLRKPPIIHFKSKKKKDDEGERDTSTQLPRVFVTFKTPHIYQLRAYVYQGRDMYGSDANGFSDPYCILSFHNYSAKTRSISQTLTPIWNETILIRGIRIYGDPPKVAESPPLVVIEFMDKDTLGRNEYIGRTEVKPVVRLRMDTPSPHLDWYPIHRYNKKAGDLLAAFELLLEEGNESKLPLIPPYDKDHYQVPPGIRPVTQRTRIEVLCWGVRDMKRFRWSQVTSPVVEIECGGGSVTSKPIRNAKDNPNFPEPVITFDVNLPMEDLYAPPLTIKVKDERSFGQCPLVGTHVVKSLRDYMVDEPRPSDAHKLAVDVAHKSVTPPPSLYEDDVVVVVEDVKEALDSDPDHQDRDKFDWWTKYYYSVGDEQRTQWEYVYKGYDKMEVYETGLEEAFNKFMDLTQTFLLYRGKGSRDPDELEGESIGAFKGSFKVYPLPASGSGDVPLVFPKTISTKKVECIVRVYIIQAENLAPRDLNGKSDPYIKVKVGKGGKGKEINDKDNYITANLNPVFGKMFQLEATLPIDHTLTVSVMDWDRATFHDLIGETKIDLENRYISQYRAHCGLPNTFCMRGVNRWRDRELPVQILEGWCSLMKYDCEWSYDNKTVIINRKDKYTLDQFEQKPLPKDDLGDPKQRLALHVIKKRCNFVPEHIEKRTLHNHVAPHMPQGSLHMWVDIFPKDVKLPPPVDISPRKPEKFELRVVIYNAVDVLLDETSVVTGEDMSDIYVKGWLRGQDETQKTDVHYRSLNGEGNFNWRMVFPFEYLPSEQVMVVRKKEHFYSLSKTVVPVAPRLTLQLWDNDKFTPDDFLGTIDLNLNTMLSPDQDVDYWSDENLPPEVALNKDAKRRSGIPEWIDIFDKKWVRGYLPLCDFDDGERIVAGKLEVEIELLTEEEACQRPAGKGREEPNMHPSLEEPHRPPTSFLWFTSPIKSFRYIIWKNYKFHIIGAVVIILAVLSLVIFIYTAPSQFMNWITNRILPG